jgi:hypothetical protein
MQCLAKTKIELFQVDRPERFQLVQAVEHVASPQLKVTGWTREKQRD